MRKINVLKNSYINSMNKGYFLSAKIYSDVRGNKCQCGGKFSEKETFKGYDFPICNKCQDNPLKMRIVASVLDVNGAPDRITIRHSQEGERLTDIVECLTTLKRITQEINEGNFDIRKYRSKEEKDSFLFTNLLEKYQAHHDKRYKNGEITFEGLRFKKRFQKRLLKHFGKVDISRIRKLHIKNFEDNFDGSHDNMMKHKSELRTILKYALEREMILKLPDLGTISKSKFRQHTMTKEEALEIISHVKNPKHQDMMKLLAIYPVRPGEIRSLKWGCVDFKKNKVTFESHFSGPDDMAGRKSRKTGQKLSSITLNISMEALEIFKRQERSLDRNAHVFKGSKIKYVTGTALNNAWDKARAKAGYSPTPGKLLQMYELKHIRLSEMNTEASGNMKILESASGVDTKTLNDRYVSVDENELNSFFQ